MAFIDLHTYKSYSFSRLFALQLSKEWKTNKEAQSTKNGKSVSETLIYGQIYQCVHNNLFISFISFFPPICVFNYLLRNQLNYRLKKYWCWKINFEDFPIWHSSNVGIIFGEELDENNRSYFIENPRRKFSNSHVTWELCISFSFRGQDWLSTASCPL